MSSASCKFGPTEGKAVIQKQNTFLLSYPKRVRKRFHTSNRNGNFMSPQIKYFSELQKPRDHNFPIPFMQSVQLVLLLVIDSAYVLGV